MIILSDLEDTLVDMRKYVNPLMESILLDMGLENFDLSKINGFNNFLEERGISLDDFWDEWTRRDDRKLAIDNGLISLFPDTLDFLKKWRVYLVSDTPLPKADLMIDHLGIRPYILRGAHYKKGDRPKPCIDYSMSLISRLKTDKFVFIGDSQADVDCGKAIERYFGVPVTTIHLRRRGIVYGADYSVDSLSETGRILDDLSAF